jgi:hypothetical protein
MYSTVAPEDNSRFFKCGAGRLPMIVNLLLVVCITEYVYSYYILNEQNKTYFKEGNII